MAEILHVYVLRSQVTDRTYVGSTADIQGRLHRHNTGQSKATRHGVPWTFVHNGILNTGLPRGGQVARYGQMKAAQLENGTQWNRMEHFLDMCQCSLAFVCIARVYLARGCGGLAGMG
jgi:hypothetical protein